MPFTLPDLPYDYAALEPTIDAREIPSSSSSAGFSSRGLISS